MKKEEKLVLWFNELDIDDVPLVGGKNASLGEMYQNLAKKGIRVPNGFTLTAHAYRFVLDACGAMKRLRKTLKGLNVKNVRALSAAGKKARDIIFSCDFPPELRLELAEAYKKLSKEYKTKDVDVAVRSSATAEDLPSASFAGQQETFLNVSGLEELVDACKRCFASLFTNRAIFYRAEKGFDHFDVALSISVQKMVRSDLASSGVMFTVDTESGFKNAVLINSAYGLGESVVQGLVNPDEFVVFKPTLKKHFRPIISKSLGEKATKIVYSDSPKKPVKEVPTPVEDRHGFSLSDDEVLQLAEWGVIIEDHYSKKHNKWTPMDVEWAKDGQSNDLFIVQARPETVQSTRDVTVLKDYKLQEKGKVICEGKAVGNRIGQGTAQVIKDVKDIHKFKEGQVLVTEMTDPDWVPIMRIASAIVTNRGGRTSHAAIVSRELGMPCVVGTNDATKKVRSGGKVTVVCSEGEEGRIYEGLLKFKVHETNLEKIPKPRTSMMMNIGNPDEAFELSFIPCDGVGLAREEFIINEYIKIHPLALLNYPDLEDKDAKDKIEEMTHAYKDKKEFFIDMLAQGVGMIAAAFYPKPVILRFSDFKSNEYANLIGGRQFEPDEENPMLGWRGASRYYSEDYEPAFALECKAVKKVREVFGLDNLKVMIPMCRTVEEGKRVLSVMKKYGLERHKKKLDVYVMCELPSNVVCADEFCKIFDGFSIGSNDLTQTVLGVDRDSALVADIFDERNEAVKRMIEQVIKVARKHKRKIGICGDAPSTYPEITKFLIKCGIDSISLSPDAVIPMTVKAKEFERK